MFQINTPEQWSHIIRAKTLIFDDDGYIYDANIPVMAEPVGQVVGEFIYGPDYNRLLTSSIIGKLVDQEDGIKILYGSSELPLYYIDGSTAYDCDSWGDLIKKARKESDAIEKRVAEKEGIKEQDRQRHNKDYNIFLVLVGLFLLWGFSVGGTHWLIQTFIDPQYADVRNYLVAGMIISTIVITVLYYKETEGFMGDVIRGVVWSDIIMTFIVDSYVFRDARLRDYSMFKSIFWGYILGSLVDIFVCLVPSIFICLSIRTLMAFCIKKEK